jgi:hypothetical protein
VGPLPIADHRAPRSACGRPVIAHSDAAATVGCTVDWLLGVWVAARPAGIAPQPAAAPAPAPLSQPSCCSIARQR